MSRGRFWCFTDNNPVSNEIEWPGFVRYAIWQREKGENGTEHLQGYLECTQTKRLAAIKNILPRAHLGLRQKTQQNCIEYCSKPETRIDGPWIHGEKSEGSGERRDLKGLKKAIDEGKSDADLWDNHFDVMLHYNRGVQEYKRIKQSPRDDKTELVVCLGPPGCGKSKMALDESPGSYWKQRSNWWDGYEGQSNIVLDDFYGWLPYDLILRLADRYPLLVETKGGQRTFNSKRMWITSNKWPNEWYKTELNLDWRAFFRRVDEFRIWNSKGILTTKNMEHAKLWYLEQELYGTEWDGKIVFIIE